MIFEPESYGWKWIEVNQLPNHVYVLGSYTLIHDSTNCGFSLMNKSELLPHFYLDHFESHLIELTREIKLEQLLNN